MTEIIRSYDPEYENFIKAHPKGHLFQSYLWGGVKSQWTWMGIKSKDESGNMRGAMGILIRKIPFLPYTLAYSPRGPVCGINDRHTLEELLAAAEKAALEAGACVLKLDPDVIIENTCFSLLLSSMGYTALPEAQDFQNIQPQFVVRLELKGKTEEEIFGNLKSKTRYNIRLSERRGVTVRVCGREELREFCRLMEITGRRDDFSVRPYKYFENMLSALGENCRLYMAYYNDTAIAGAICACFGDKAWYLYGASDNRCRDKMPNYLLQWHMIQWAVARRCSLYDFRGISGDTSPDSPLYGLWRFKSGWGGRFTEFVGEFEKPLRPTAYKLISRLIPSGRHLLILLNGLISRCKNRNNMV